MTGEAPSCPYCNARLDGLPALVAGQRVSCPRCGESFTVTATQAATGASGITATPPAAVVPPRATRGNRLVAAVVLGVMACMAVAGLTFALLTQKDRRAHDTGIPRRPKRFPVPEELPETPSPPPVTPLAPSRLPALGYLSPGTDLVAGVRVAEVVQDKDARGLLNDPIKVGPVTFRLADLREWTGLSPYELDHVVVGVRARNLRLNIVVRTRQPYDAERVRATLKAQPEPSKGKKALYRIEPPKLGLPLLLWCADDHTLVLGLRPSDLREAPDTPAEGLDPLAPDLRIVVSERMGPAGALWAAGHIAGWDKGLAGVLQGWLKPEDVRRVRSVRTFAVWLDLGPPLTARGVFRARDEAAARALDDYVRSLKPEGGAIKTARERDWLTVQLRTDLATVRRALGR